MKEKKSDILSQIGRKSGFSVPENYFDNFAKEMENILPKHEVIPEIKPSKWNKIRPYIYMTAMFAGIWCMMQMFHHISNVGNVSLEEPPAHIAALMEDPEISDYYSVPSDESDYELESEVSEAYSDMEEFEKDFGYEISPEYDKIDL